MPFGPTHTTIRLLATYATQSFFSRIQVDGAEHVPKEEEGPILAVANHWNSAVDREYCGLSQEFCWGGRREPQ
jgi:glycerol-3-phosphate O-acyltransferase/dihydroxyacetone phosphate acyltransferase